MFASASLTSLALTSAEIAAWVQAIGSIVAILAGFGFVMLQHWQEKRSRVQTLLGLAGSVVILLNGLRVTFENISGRHEHAVVFRRASSDLRALRDVIFSVDLSPIGHEVMWTSIGGLVSSMDTLTDALDRRATMLESSASDEPLLEAQQFIADKAKYAARQVRSISNAAKKYYSVSGTRRQVTLRFVDEVEMWAV